ncbi:MAG TPA: hypothetical protein VLI40_05940, partial [Gemmatimonadaceae bacterium]|nr:hypothetical protein [Gemmatimonadaceae bacterium]
MSDHGPHVFTRGEVIAGSQTPIASWVKMSCVILAIIGTVTFIFGAFVGADRAWQALHFNWLFFS